MSVAAGVAPELAAAPAPIAPRRRSRTALIVFLLTTLNALGWGFIVPPFHIPDEASHVFYAQYLGETGKLPVIHPGTDWYSADINAMLNDGAFYWVVGRSTSRPPWGPDAKRQLTRDQTANLERVGRGDAASASNNPPLYYLAQAAVYRAGHGLGPMNRLALMRALSALMAGLTALCIFCFLRELLPGTPLAWTTGALTAGLLPMFAFVSSGVNNDGGLYLVSAALMLALARLLRRGLTPRRAATVGVLLAAGVLVKTQMLAYAPAVGLAALVALRRGRGNGRSPWPSLLSGAAAAVAPLALYGLLGATVWNRPLFDRVGAVTASPAATSGAHLPTLSEQISFLWQEYLPRLPFMTDLLPGFQLWTLWFKGLVGRFGWLDYGYPPWAYVLALGIVLLITGAAIFHLWQRRDAVRRRAGEVAVFGLVAAGLPSPSASCPTAPHLDGSAVRAGALPAAAAAAVRSRPGADRASGGPALRVTRRRAAGADRRRVLRVRAAAHARPLLRLSRVSGGSAPAGARPCAGPASTSSAAASQVRCATNASPAAERRSHSASSSSRRSMASASAIGSACASSIGPSAPNTLSSAAARQLDARQPAGEHLLRDQRVVRQRQREADRRLRVRPASSSGRRRRDPRTGTASAAAAVAEEHEAQCPGGGGAAPRAPGRRAARRGAAVASRA